MIGVIYDRTGSFLLQEIKTLDELKNYCNIGENNYYKGIIDPCWIWPKGINKNNPYGIISIKDEGKTKRILAHIFAYELSGKKYDPSLELDHKCEIKACVNPNHLVLIEPIMNVKRVLKQWRYKHKEKCPKGHSYSGKNLYVTKKSIYQCKTCSRDRYLSRTESIVKRRYRRK